MNRFDQIVAQMTDGRGADGDHSHAHLVAMLLLLSHLYNADQINYRAHAGQSLWDEFVLQLREVHPWYADRVAQMHPGGMLSRPLP